MEPLTANRRPAHHRGRKPSRPGWSVALGMAAAITVASCGGDDARGLSEAELVARANEVCAQHTQHIVAAAKSRFRTPEVPAAGALVNFAQQTVVPEAEKLVGRLESVNAPADEAAEFDEYLRKLNRALERMKGAPSMVFSEIEAHDVFREANEVANDLRLTACAGASEQWSNAPFLRDGWR